MTFRDKLAQEHPKCIDSRLVSGCEGCPHDYGYEPEFACGSMPCKDCWSREMPMTPEEQEANDGGRPQAAPTEDAPAIRLPDSVTVRIGPENDPVNHPSHYTAGGIECIDAIAAALACQTDPVEAWLTGQIIKYLWRWPLKNGVEDLRKARWYLDKLIGEVEGKT